MGLRDLLKKKDQLDDGAGTNAETLDRLRAGPEFTFIRSDTHTQEIIHPPSHYGDSSSSNHLKTKDGGSSSGKPRRSLDVFRSSRSRASSTSSAKSDYLGAAPKEGSGGHRRLSQRLGLSSRGGKNATSEYVPGDLPQISITGDGDADTQQGDGDGDDGGRGEREWEKRATMLAQAADESERRRSRSPAAPELAGLSLGGDDAAAPRRRSNSGVVSSKTLDEDIQEAIRLHEEGELEKSTSLFGRLADPQGANNPLSQVLYGLALRLVICWRFFLLFSVLSFFLSFPISEENNLPVCLTWCDVRSMDRSCTSCVIISRSRMHARTHGAAVSTTITTATTCGMDRSIDTYMFTRYASSRC